jgi:hypothetical protein
MRRAVRRRAVALASGLPLRITPRMARLVGAALVSSAGDWLSRLALPLVVYRMTGSAALTAISYAR